MDCEVRVGHEAQVEVVSVPVHPVRPAAALADVSGRVAPHEAVLLRLDAMARRLVSDHREGGSRSHVSLQRLPLPAPGAESELRPRSEDETMARGGRA